MHFIGSLQTNKVKYIADSVEMIHSVDSAKLAREIGKRAAAAGRTVKVLIEINSGREPDKGGVLPENAEELFEECGEIGGIETAGFMTMGPKYDNYTDYADLIPGAESLTAGELAGYNGLYNFFNIGASGDSLFAVCLGAMRRAEAGSPSRGSPD